MFLSRLCPLNGGQFGSLYVPQSSLSSKRRLIRLSMFLSRLCPLNGGQFGSLYVPQSSVSSERRSIRLSQLYVCLVCESLPGLHNRDMVNTSLSTKQTVYHPHQIPVLCITHHLHTLLITNSVTHYNYINSVNLHTVFICYH